MSGGYAAASPGQGVPNIAALLAGFGGRLPTLTDRQYAANNAVFNVYDFGAVGDGVTDDSVAFNKATVAALGTDGVAGVVRCGRQAGNSSGAGQFLISNPVSVPAGVLLDLTGAVVIANASISLGAHAAVQNGQITWTTTNAIDALVPVGDYCNFLGINFVGNGTIGNAGAALYQRGINGTKYSYGSVVNCSFSNMTVGLWLGGASTDPNPTGWRISGNTFTNIVGYRGQSEGYGCLLTPANDCCVIGNTFYTIARHAIYLAGGACKNIIANNIIDTCDNVGIQVNTFFAQPASDGNAILGNVISNITKSIAYGYLSAVAIGIYGNNTNTFVAGNRLSRFVDSGITWSSVATDHTGSCVGFGLVIEGNWIDGITGVAGSDSCIRTDNPDNVTVQGNTCMVANNQYGLVVTSTFPPLVNTSLFAANNFRGYGAASLMVRISGNQAANTFRNNRFAGLGTTYTTDADIGGSTIDAATGYVGIGDADYSYVQGVSPSTLFQAIALTANRVITLGLVGAAPGTTVRVSRSSAGASSLSVKDGGGTALKVLAQNQWGDFTFNGAAWVESGFGSY